jgi:hypothetical protein
MQRFRATLQPVRRGGHYVCVPAPVAGAAGLEHGARVRGTVGAVAYRAALVKYSGVFHLGVHKATIAAAKAASGDEVAVTIERDDEPLPGDTVPPDMARAISQRAAVQRAWDALAPSHKREHVRHVLEAKQAATRARRIATTVATLTAQPRRTRAR